MNLLLLELLELAEMATKGPFKFHLRLCVPWGGHERLESLKDEIKETGCRTRDTDCTTVTYNLDISAPSLMILKAAIHVVEESGIKVSYAYWDEGRIPNPEARSRWHFWEDQKFFSDDPLKNVYVPPK